MSEPKNVQDLKKEMERQTREKEQKQEQSEWRRLQNLCALRGRAQRAMETLTDSLQEIRQLSKHPERDFAKIFQKEERYVGMVNACHEAYRKSYESKARLIDQQNALFLRNAAWSAGLDPKEKDLFNAGKRAVLVNKIRRQGKREGQDYLKRPAQEAFKQKHRKKDLWLATCPECQLKQLPNIRIDPCPKCGFKGPVFPDYYYDPDA
jgi:hypothetical protein